MVKRWETNETTKEVKIYAPEKIQMQLCLDSREHALIQLMPEATVKTLILGDAVIERNGKEFVIIERKTIADFVASICDGRYNEQSARLQAYDIPNHNVLYLIEGSLKTIAIPFQKRRCYQA